MSAVALAVRSAGCNLGSSLPSSLSLSLLSLSLTYAHTCYWHVKTSMLIKLILRTLFKCFYFHRQRTVGLPAGVSKRAEELSCRPVLEVEPHCLVALHRVSPLPPVTGRPQRSPQVFHQPPSLRLRGQVRSNSTQPWSLRRLRLLAAFTLLLLFSLCRPPSPLPPPRTLYRRGPF